MEFKSNQFKLVSHPFQPQEPKKDGMTYRGLMLVSELEEDGVRIALTLIDTKGFGDNIDNEYWSVLTINLELASS
jgi:septin family protein